MDHIGPIALCVRDLALIFQAIAERDAAMPVPDLKAVVSGPLSRPRIGRLRGFFEERAEPGVLSLLDDLVSAWQSRGAEIKEMGLPAAFAEVLPRHRKVMAVEAARYHEERLRRHPEDYEPNIRSLLEEGLACPATEYARCKQHQDELMREMSRLCLNADVLLTLATTGPAPDRRTTGDLAFNAPWSYTGVPTVSFPAGGSPEGLPLGVQLIGRMWKEAELLAAAAWCEDVLGLAPLVPPIAG
jgi:aspartyl-tRNA(Asn)/glutamyl-tRNA(Gln) amidotransferase subunit A